MLRGIRGAIEVTDNSRDAILDAAETLMNGLVKSNRIRSELVSSVFFTVTPDLNACFFAEVRTRIGWQWVPFLCGQEIPVPNSMERILRVLILLDTEQSQQEVEHLYLGSA